MNQPIQAAAPSAADGNPFFQDWTGPFGAPPFERIAPEHFNVRLAAAPYSPSTPALRPLEARLVLAGDGSADLTVRRQVVRGADGAVEEEVELELAG